MLTALERNVRARRWAPAAEAVAAALRSDKRLEMLLDAEESSGTAASTPAAERIARRGRCVGGCPPGPQHRPAIPPLLLGPCLDELMDAPPREIELVLLVLHALDEALDEVRTRLAARAEALLPGVPAETRVGRIGAASRFAVAPFAVLPPTVAERYADAAAAEALAHTFERFLPRGAGDVGAMFYLLWRGAGGAAARSISARRRGPTATCCLAAASHTAAGMRPRGSLCM
eukprot:gnl/Chilomastix_cuspidata/951.p2 GENE.gnl/Chilomastix_cuspidata/951~~gnl/Chilomastix_cuspidata/951.p2  ORF type:complete len:231 (-),score=105.31 gnl/Chilomastix_cuspidata/951:946-1638(-)